MATTQMTYPGRKLPVRSDARFSALVLLLALRRAQAIRRRLGLKAISNADIRAKLRREPLLCRPSC